MTPSNSPSLSDDTFDENAMDELSDAARQAAIDEDIARADLDDPVLSDIEIAPDTDASLHAPILDAPDTPGEIDIEDLDDDALDDAPLPPDARLDPLED